jgi:hypothetical protein
MLDKKGFIITRYLLDKMDEDTINILHNELMSSNACDEDLSEYGMSLGVLNSLSNTEVKS